MSSATIRYIFSTPDKNRTDYLGLEVVRYFVALARHEFHVASPASVKAHRGASLVRLLHRWLSTYPGGKDVFDEAITMDEAALSVLRRLDATMELRKLLRFTAGRSLVEGFLIVSARAASAPSGD